MAEPRGYPARPLRVRCLQEPVLGHEARRHADGPASEDDSLGHRRTNADKRRTVEIALREFPNLSSRALAQMCGVSNMLVDSIRPAQVKESFTSPRTGQDGKTYPARRVVPEPQEPAHDEPVMERPTLLGRIV